MTAVSDTDRTAETEARPWTEQRAAEVSRLLRNRPAADILTWALDELSPAIALGTGLGVEGVVILDHLSRLGRLPRVFMLDTGRLPQETYELLDRIRDRYRVEIEIFTPNPQDLEPMVREHGANLFYREIALR